MLTQLLPQPSPDFRPLDFIRSNPVILNAFEEALRVGSEKTEQSIRLVNSPMVRGLHRYGEINEHLVKFLSADDYYSITHGGQPRVTHEDPNTGDITRIIHRSGVITPDGVRFRNGIGMRSREFILEQGAYINGGQTELFKPSRRRFPIYKELMTICERILVEEEDEIVLVQRHYIIYPTGFIDGSKLVQYADSILLTRSNLDFSQTEGISDTSGVSEFDPLIEERDEDETDGTDG